MDALLALVLFAGYFAIGILVCVVALAVKIHFDERRRIRPFDWDIDKEFARLLRDRARDQRAAR